jgi:uncharacterized protein (DUF1697 family)
MAKQTWVALLRAVNLGARNRVAMPQLREVLSEQGCEDVRTYIASGNAVFTSSTAKTKLAGELERAIEKEFGVATPVVLRTAREMAAVVKRDPFDDAAHTHVAFLAKKPTATRVKALGAVDIAPDRVRVHGNEAFFHLPNGVQGSRLSGAQLEKHLGVPATVRNWRTVARLAEMAAEG